VGIRTVTAPTIQPIEILGLAALKQHLTEAADVTDNDGLISEYCRAAWDYCERYSWRQLLTATLRLTMPKFRDCVCIPRPRTIAILSVEYYDDSNVLQTLSTANWACDLDCDVVELELWDFPTVYQRPDAVRINFTAGYGNTVADFPPVLLHAVRLLVGQYYETREPSNAETDTVDALLEAIANRDERLTEFE
jgi:uncharacterized phiE125 gp8 family phage protein